MRLVQEHILRGGLDAQIEFVFSNRAPGEAEGSDEYFQLVTGYDISLHTMSSRQFRRTRGGSLANHRDEFDRQVMTQLRDYQVDVCVLAGYMLIVGGAMCRQYSLLNLHPALPGGPIGTWQEVIWALIEQRASHTGAMMHLATEDVDRGPVVSYCTASISGGEFGAHWDELERLDLELVKSSPGEAYPLFQLIRQAEYLREPYLLLETLRALADGHLAIRGLDVLDSTGQHMARSAPHGLCLDPAIERAMAEDAAEHSR